VSGSREAAESIHAANAVYVFCGHVHEQRLLLHRRERQADVVSAGSRHSHTHVEVSPLARDRRVGRPAADGNNAACYALFDSERERLTIFFALRTITVPRSARFARPGLPDRLALRLERGSLTTAPENRERDRRPSAWAR
jgi:hypothetical protein